MLFFISNRNPEKSPSLLEISLESGVGTMWLLTITWIIWGLTLGLEAMLYVLGY